MSRWYCNDCKIEFESRRKLFAHNKVCPHKYKVGNHYISKDFMGQCPFCDRTFRQNYSLSNHISICAKNPNRNLEKVERLKSAQQKLYQSDKGKELRKKASERTVFNNFWEYRSKNPIIYESKFAGKVKLDSKWELIVAERLDSLGIDWYKPRIRLPYYDLEGNEHGYYPDFYIKDYKCFIEVKSPFIANYQNSKNKIDYVKEHYKFVTWLESEEQCRTFILKEQNCNIIPPKLEYNINSLIKQKEKHTNNYKGGFIDSELEKKRWTSIQESNIDFSKFGWVDKLSKLWGISSNKTGIYVRKHFPKFYEEKCFKRFRVN